MILGLKNNGSVYVAEEAAVGGHNPENAEPGNPSGSWYKTIYAVQIDLGGGETYRHVRVWEDGEELECERFIDRVQAHLDAGGDLSPNHWRFLRLVYGSEAYINQGGEHEEMMLEAKEDGRFAW